MKLFFFPSFIHFYNELLHQILILKSTSPSVHTAAKTTYILILKMFFSVLFYLLEFYENKLGKTT